MGIDMEVGATTGMGKIMPPDCIMKRGKLGKLGRGGGPDIPARDSKERERERERERETQTNKEDASKN